MAKKKPDHDQGKEKRRGHGEGSWQYLDDLDKYKYRVSVKDPDGVTRRFSVTAATKGECCIRLQCVAELSHQRRAAAVQAGPKRK